MNINFDDFPKLFDVVIYEDSANVISIEACPDLITNLTPPIEKHFNTYCTNTQIQINVHGIYDTIALAERIATPLELEGYKVGRRLTNQGKKEHVFTQSFILQSSIQPF
jgi:hypothetical protein